MALEVSTNSMSINQQNRNWHTTDGQEQRKKDTNDWPLTAKEQIFQEPFNLKNRKTKCKEEKRERN